ncbi:putative dockerin type I repeat [Synechococcus sp. BIOS-E4-1]|nr:putative dockerin type I repeat [Synechococcus sp. BIOS-E4-1]
MQLRFTMRCQHRVSSDVDAMPRSVSAVVFGSLLCLLAGCSTGGSGADQRQSKQLKVLFCNVKSGTFIDANRDSVLSVGDSVSYRLAVARLGGAVQSCEQPNGSFYGLEEVIERRVHDGETVFLTHAQGTLTFKDGNIQTRSLGSLQLSAGVTPSLESGSMQLPLGDLFPSNHGATLIGQGGAFSGYVGSADFVSATPPYALLKLHSQFPS